MKHFSGIEKIQMMCFNCSQFYISGYIYISIRSLKRQANSYFYRFSLLSVRVDNGWHQF
jgi:hypothetical protein